MKPFYKWAGGKSRLLDRYSDVWPSGDYSFYVEPFFGGGAVYAWLYTNGALPRNAIVSDANIELAEMLRNLRDDCDSFVSDCEKQAKRMLSIPSNDKKERKALYYEMRAEYWKRQSPSLLYVLMQLSFNGIWQTCKESKGLFGTPAGLLAQTKMAQIVDAVALEEWSAALSKAWVMSVDYADLVFPAKGALVYLDPPYRGSYTTYGRPFDDADQKRVCEYANGLARRGATVLLSNRCCEGDGFFEDLLPDAEFHYFDVKYTAGRRKKRKDGGYEAKPAREFLAVLGA